jgi:GntR family transcriptional regulator
LKSDRRIKLDSRPLYVQAVEALKLLVSEEPYLPGDRLPPEGELADLLGISRTTLRMAMGHLELEGVVVRRQGVGTFVAENSVKIREGMESLTSLQALAGAAGLRSETSTRDVRLVPASNEWAETLGVVPGSTLSQVQCTISIEGRPVAFMRTLAPTTWASPDELETAIGSLLEFLIAQNDPAPNHTLSKIHTVPADPFLADQLKVPEGEALLYLIETYFTQAGDPIALSHNYFVSDRFGFYISRQISR